MNKICIILVSIILINYSCSKEALFDNSKIKISYITDVGNFEYMNSLPTQIGNKILFYDEDERINKIMYSKMDTSRFGLINPDGSLENVNLEITTTYYAISVIRELETTLVHLDTLLITSTNNTFSAFNVPLELYYHRTGTRIDSIDQLNYFPSVQEERFEQSKFLYEGDNLVSTKRYCFLLDISDPFGNITTEKFKCEISYGDFDEKNNPNSLFRPENQPFIPNLGNASASRNNNRYLKSVIYREKDTIRIESDISYIYNECDYPTVISSFQRNLQLETNKTINYAD